MIDHQKEDRPRRTRRAGTFRKAIESAILRRLVACESLSIRAIIAEAGGGSTTTVREELEKIGVAESGKFLDGDMIRSFAERESALRERLHSVSSEVSTLRESNAALRMAIAQAAEPSAVLERQVSDIGRDVRLALQDVLRETTRIRKAREKATETIVAPDPLAEARYQKLMNDHTKLIERHRKLKQRYFDATGDIVDD